MSTQPRIIDITPAGDVAFLINVEPFLKALKPIGTIANTVGKILACRVEMRRLKVEAEELQLEYRATTRMIDGNMEYAMQRLEVQRIGMERYFNYASKQLATEQLFSSQRIKVIREMTALLADQSQSFEVKALAQETINAMSRDLIAAQSTSSTALSVLVNSSTKNLAIVPSFAGLFPSGWIKDDNVVIWWLVVGVIGVMDVANAILNRLRQAAEKERTRWESDYMRVEREIKDNNRQIQYKLKEAQYALDFQALTSLHFESLKMADHAYSLLQDSRVSLNAIGYAIVEAGKEKNRLIAQKRKNWSPKEAYELEQEINALVELNRQLYPDKDQLKAQRDRFYQTVKQLNARTLSLKLAIRDRCGEQGRDWYLRFSRQTSSKRPDLLVRTEETQIRGTVKWFDPKKGFGFITPHDGQGDVYVSQRNLRKGLLLRENDQVLFERRLGDKGPLAINVKKA